MRCFNTAIALVQAVFELCLPAFDILTGSTPAPPEWEIAAENSETDHLTLAFTTSPTPGSLVGFDGGTIVGSAVLSFSDETFYESLSGTITPVPEPSSLGILAVALLAFSGIAGLRKRKPVVYQVAQPAQGPGNAADCALLSRGETSTAMGIGGQLRLRQLCSKPILDKLRDYLMEGSKSVALIRRLGRGFFGSRPEYKSHKRNGTFQTEPFPSNLGEHPRCSSPACLRLRLGRSTADAPYRP